MAALRPRMLRLAAERAAGAHPYLVTPEHTHRARAILGFGPLPPPSRRSCSRRTPGVPGRSAGPRSPATCSSRTTPTTSDGWVSPTRTWQAGEATPSSRPCTPEDIEARVREHHDAGADHVAVQVLTNPDAAGLPHEQWRLLAPALTR